MRRAHAAKARRARYYLTDNFLRAWLAALAGPVAALNFRPLEQLVADADQRLCDVEGKAFEKLVYRRSTIEIFSGNSRFSTKWARF